LSVRITILVPKIRRKSWPSWRRSGLPRAIVGESSISNQVVTNYQMMNFSAMVKRKRLTVENIVDASFELISRPDIIDAYEESFASRHLVVLHSDIVGVTLVYF
jgi:hypothetical protein